MTPFYMYISTGYINMFSVVPSHIYTDISKNLIWNDNFFLLNCYTVFVFFSIRAYMQILYVMDDMCSYQKLENLNDP